MLKLRAHQSPAADAMFGAGVARRRPSARPPNQSCCGHPSALAGSPAGWLTRSVALSLFLRFALRPTVRRLPGHLESKARGRHRRAAPK